MRILITGSTGQLGLALKQVFPNALLLDRNNLDLMLPSAEIKKKVIALAPDIFINGAAFTSVDEAEQNVSKAYQVNGTAVRAITDACQETNSYLFHISTDYVFDVQSRNAHLENERPNPVSVYGRSKWVGETYVRGYSRATLIRTSWLFGEGSNFVQSILKKSATTKRLSVVMDQVGRPTSTEDLAQAIKKLTGLLKYQTLPSILHIQNEGETVSWAQFAEEILRFAKRNSVVLPVTAEEYQTIVNKPLAVRPSYSVFDLSLLHSLGIEMSYWRESLIKYINTCNL